jgi:hypothetical protein
MPIASHPSQIGFITHSRFPYRQSGSGAELSNREVSPPYTDHTFERLKQAIA